MIRISQIDDRFSIYKENTVVLLGVGQGTKQLLDLMCYHNIDIHYICDNNKDNCGKVLEGITVISPSHLQQLSQSKNTQHGVVVQIAVNKKNFRRIHGK